MSRFPAAFALAITAAACVPPPTAGDGATPPSTGAPAGAPADYPPLTPARVLEGARLAIDGTGMSLVIPAGWRHGWSDAGGEPVLVIEPPVGGPRGAVLATARRLAPEERRRPPTELLAALAADEGGGLDFAAPTGFTASGRRGARTSAPGADATTVLAGVIDGDWAIVFVVSHAPADGALYQAVLDTLLVTLDGALPAAATDAAAVVGCWQAYVRSTTSGGGSQTIQVRLAADGSYRWRSHTRMPGYYSDPYVEDGRYEVDGDQLRFFPATGAAQAMAFAFDDHALVLGHDRFVAGSCPP